MVLPNNFYFCRLKKHSWKDDFCGTTSFGSEFGHGLLCR